MTQIAELARDLSLGHLSDLPAFGDGDGVIAPSQLPKLLSRLNDALRALYTRFPLETKTLVIQAVAGRYMYPLRQEFALTSGSTEPVKFIVDTPESPFRGDVLGIEHVFDTGYCQLPLNDRQDPLSLHTPSYDVLRIDKPKTVDRYYVEYRAMHTPVPVSLTDLCSFELRVPSALMSALKLHIAASLYEGGNNETLVAKGLAYGRAYEQECASLERGNVLNQSMVDTNIKPQLGGWI